MQKRYTLFTAIGFVLIRIEANIMILIEFTTY